MNADYIISKGTIEDFKIAVDQTFRFHGWNHCYADYESWQKAYGADNVLFLVAKTKAESTFIGCVALANVTRNLSTIGMFFVNPDYRGKGIGTVLFEELLAKVDKGRNLGLNADAEMVSKYDQRYGFNKYTPWKTRIHLLSNIDVDYVKAFKFHETISIVDVSAVDEHHLLDYDATITREENRRDRFATVWTHRPDVIARVAIDRANGEIRGYIVGRRVPNGKFSLCPLYADSPAIAKQLIIGLLQNDDDLKNRNCVMYMPAVTSEKLLAEVTDFVTVTPMKTITGQYTKFIPDTNYTNVYSFSDPGLSFI